MKTGAVRKARMLALSVTFLGVFVYSILALSTKPAYASSCDCTEAHEEALEICNPNGGLLVFACPVGSAENEFYYECGNGERKGYLFCPV